MRLHYFQHVPFEDAGNIAAWAAARGYSLTCTRLYEGQPLPELDSFDWLILMGGPMSVHDEAIHPWLQPEKRYVRQAIRAGKTLLGVCLGAQLLAEALGGRVRVNEHREIGWWPVYLAPEARAAPLLADWPIEFLAFHWHGETFSLPPRTVPLGASDACGVQGFFAGETIVALQFHLEYSMESILAMVDDCAEEMDGSTFVQPPERLIAHYSEVESIRRRLNVLLDGMERQWLVRSARTPGRSTV